MGLIGVRDLGRRAFEADYRVGVGRICRASRNLCAYSDFDM